MEPGGRQPAPGDLALVQQFINTLDLETGVDQVGGPDDLHRWLLAHSLIDRSIEIDRAGYRRALELRETLRTLLTLHHGAQPDPRGIAAFNNLAAALPLRLNAGPDGRMSPESAGDGIDGALGRMLAIVYAATVDGTWSRLKVCPADTCRWAFYDHSKNRSSTWCTMAICGNRSKVRTYQQRRRIRT